ncbi:efflux RND transporter periplasmic adaptor subunit [Telmatospirillum sp. J64-1]|uniref:efflux RND transporter periplasmic adaptor subunit n=1 Tax=Telmatospirillum sp. J64-1 TaxID=2502183 RepID=UPI001C8F9F05|nr:efflux RND transporter periplasmic adaptor subunit [Telmatospirillum sp. J64-1]
MKRCGVERNTTPTRRHEVRLKPPVKTSTIVFVAIIVLAVLWFGSGVLTRDDAGQAAEEGAPARHAVTSVAASWSEAQRIERQLTLYGDVEPDQVVLVRAQTAGQVEALETELGDLVEPGTPLARLAMQDRMSRMRRAEAQVAGAQSDYDAASQLAAQGHAPAIREDMALAELEAARAELDAIRVEIENTEIRAPIHGTVNRILADLGDYVGIGGEVVEIVTNDPLRAVVQVPQHAIHRIEPGRVAYVTAIGDEPVEGKVHFIAPLADAATRTFRVEILVPNPDRRLPAGISAEVMIPTETVMAHKVSPALVSLDEQGQVGVKTVNEDGIVAFHPIELVRTEPDGVWVTGVPEKARIITIGQGFVQAGQQVSVRDTPQPQQASQP